MQTQPKEMKMANYRFDEDFDGFLEDFGEPHDGTPIPESVIQAYRDKLPEQLFVYWRALGACGFRNGLLWMVNPAEYQDLLDMWLDGTPFESRTDLSVIARNAFGYLRVWAKGKGTVIEINPNLNIIYHDPKNDTTQLDEAQEARKVQFFWGSRDVEDVDDTDESEKPLFARALKKLGQLKSDEMYGYKHRLALGGKEDLSNLDIVKLEVYHNIAQQMEPLEIITLD
jgi:hypothetical protein